MQIDGVQFGDEADLQRQRGESDFAREQDLRPIQIWVPDVRSPAFRSEAHRQSAAIAGSAHAREDQAFIDAVTDWGGK